MLTRAGFALSKMPSESHRQMPYGALVTSERKLISERRKPSWAERNAALNEQISSATNTNRVRCMIALRYSAGECSPAKEKYALTVRAKEVATRPGFQPPYQALTIMATANTTRRLSTTSASISAGIKARVMLRIATPYRRMGARAGGM